MMRTQVTFILRLWVDPQAEEPTWEGQVEEVAGGERAHVRSPEELARFIEAQTSKDRSDSQNGRDER
jgi:hypothetical protein